MARGAEAPGRAAAVPVVAGGVAAVLMALLSFQGASVLGDPDTQWHVASGRLILETLSFPVADSFSHTFAGQPWIAKEWGGQVALAGAHALAGWTGVTLLAAAMAALAYGLVAAHAARHLETAHVLALIVVCALAGSIGILARPNLVTLPLFAVFVMGLMPALDGRDGRDGRDRAEARPPWWLLAVMVVWANSHGLFTLGFVIAACAGLQALADAPARRKGAVAFQWAAFGVALLLSACITPYGLQPLLMTFTLAGGEPIEFIREWEPLPFDGAGLAGYLLLAVALAASLAAPRRNLGRILVLAFLGYMMAKHMRFALQFSVAGGLLAAAPLADLISRARGAGPGVPAWRDVRAAAGGRMAAAGLAILLLGPVLAAALPAGTPPARVHPLGALAAARAAGLQGPVFNAYDFGGFLAFAGVPTFVDGRTDQLFINGFRRRMEAALRQDAPDGLGAFIAPYGVSWALVPPGGDEARLLGRLGWTTLHADDAALVMRAP